MSQAVKNADAFPDVKEAGVSEAEGETHQAKNELKSNPSQEKRVDDLKAYAEQKYT